MSENETNVPNPDQVCGLGSSDGSAEFSAMTDVSALMKSFEHLRPRLGDMKFHWSLPVDIDPTDFSGSITRNIIELENVYKAVCCVHSLFPGEKVHLAAGMLNQAIHVLKSIESVCVSQ